MIFYRFIIPFFEKLGNNKNKDKCLVGFDWVFRIRRIAKRCWIMDGFEYCTECYFVYLFIYK
jgi:hypothetical protein